MKARPWLWWILACVMAVQLAVPAYMIFRQETILKEGSLFKLKTVPVDPYDAFRGRYVSLAFEIENLPLSEVALDGIDKSYTGPAYATLATGADGFAAIRKISLKSSGDDSTIPVEVRYHFNPKGDSFRLKVHFDRYYMEESKAPEAERLYRAHSNQIKQNAAALIRVKNGTVAIEDLLIEEKPIREFFRQNYSKP